MKKFTRILLFVCLGLLGATTLSFLILDLPKLRVRARENQNTILQEVFPTGVEVRLESGDPIKIKAFNHLDFRGENCDVRIEEGKTYSLEVDKIQAKDFVVQERDRLRIDQKGGLVRFIIRHPHPEDLELSLDMDNGKLGLYTRLKKSRISLDSGQVAIASKESFPLDVEVDSGQISCSIDYLNARLRAQTDMGHMTIKGDSYSGFSQEIDRTFGQGRDPVKLVMDMGQIQVD